MHCTWNYSSLLLAFVLVASIKYFRLLVNCIAYWTYHPIPISDDPKYTCKDVTVVIPSLDGEGDDLRQTLRSCLRNEPIQVILVTIDANYKKAEDLAKNISKKILVLSIPKANKRSQMCQALPYINTDITIFADDDVIWPSTLLPWVLAAFEDEKVGGVGTSQRLRRESNPNFWNFLGAAYLLRRNWDIISCNRLDGGLPCLSGRTVAYRTKIIRDPEFSYAFTNETWRSFQLNADDDNFLTRWLMNNGWNIHIQKHQECEVETTLEDNRKFLLQCLRWARSNWRSNLKSLVIERTVWRRYPWSTYAVFQTTVTSWSLVYDLIISWLWWHITIDLKPEWRLIARISVYLWIFLICRVIKYTEHFCRYPADLIYVPLIPFFGYYHSIWIKLHAMLTLQVTTWGSREGADNDDSYRMINLPEYRDSTPSSSKLSDDIIDQSSEEYDALLPRYEHPAEY